MDQVKFEVWSAQCGGTICGRVDCRNKGLEEIGKVEWKKVAEDL